MTRLLARKWFTPLVVAFVIAWGASARTEPRAPLRVAVLDFENVSNDHSLDPLGKGLQSFLTTDLSQAQALQLVERARLADVQSELKLGKSGAVDPKTAARVGKLLGASHLLTGTFTVVGSKMRIDCRLFAVQNGAILLAEKGEGDKDAFFEVEKSLVTRVLAAIEVQPKPKERAAIMKPQTADFEAFRDFSRGIELFDEKRYEDAITALKEARKRDQDFKLAEVTQAEYERVIAGLRTEAAAIGSRERAASRRAGRAEAQVEMDAIDKLYAIAAKKGADARFERLAALGALATWFAQGRPSPSAPPAIPDTFSQHRVAAVARQAYVAEASALYPQVSLAPPSVDSDLFLQAGAFDAELAKLVAKVRAPKPDDLLRMPDPVAVLPADRADQHARLYGLVAKRNPPREWQVTELVELAHEYRAAADFNRSTAYLKQAAGLAEGADRKRALEDMANELELNQQLSDALKKATTPARREMVEIASLHRGYENQELAEYGSPHGWNAMRELPMSSGDPGRGPVLLGKHPAWVFGIYDHSVHTGLRHGGLATSELRYYWEQNDKQISEILSILDGTGRGDFTAQFTVSFTPAADFSPHSVPRPSASAVEAGVDPRRAGFGVLFGVAQPQCCESTGYALMLLPDTVRLVRFVQNPSELKASESYAKKVVDEQRVGLLGPGPTKVAVKVTDKNVEVTAGGRTVRLRVPDDHHGFYGFYFGGHGYASVADVDFK